MTGFAERLPARVMAAGLGFEGAAAVEFAETAVSFLSARHPSKNPSADRASLALQLSALVKARRESAREDLVSRMISLLQEQEEDSPSVTHLVSTCIFLLVTGWQVTVDLLGNGLLCLLNHPAAYASLFSEPDGFQQAVDESLRLESPLQMVDRWVLEDLEMGGKSLRRGQRIYLVLGAANRDPARFEEPDTWDFRRRENRHFALGGGTHACLGARLARAEAEAAFRVLPSRLADLRLASTRLQWSAEANFRSLLSLPIRYKRN